MSSNLDRFYKWSYRDDPALVRRFRESIYPADEGGCPNGPDENDDWPCDPKGYFGVLECQVCGRIGVVPEEGWPGQKR